MAVNSPNPNRHSPSLTGTEAHRNSMGIDKNSMDSNSAIGTCSICYGTIYEGDQYLTTRQNGVQLFQHIACIEPDKQSEPVPEPNYIDLKQVSTDVHRIADSLDTISRFVQVIVMRDKIKRDTSCFS